MVFSLRDEFKLKDLLNYVGLSKSTYCYWRWKFANPQIKEIDPAEQAILKIKKQYPNLGYRGVRALLQKSGLRVNHKKIQRIIREHGLQVTCHSSKSRFSTDRGIVGKIAPNRLKRRFGTSVPHQKIVTDTSEFKYYVVDDKGNRRIEKLYLNPFMDLYNREIISYTITKHADVQSMLPALYKAIEVTVDCEFRRTFHTDQGVLYQSKSYQQHLKDNRIFQSMSRRGNCHDNAVMECFFGLLKKEIYFGNIFESFDELRDAIETYIAYYNQDRIKERLGWMSPVKYRLFNQAA